MFEIRSPHPDELDGMLALMCEAFGLPFGPAREVFYKDPYFDVNRKRVLVEDGAIVSCLTIVDSTLWIGKAAVKVAGIASVSTRESHRRRGYAGRLLLETLLTLRTLGYGFSALFPFSYDYYRRFGWELAGAQYRAVLSPHRLPRCADSRYVRPALSADQSDMQRLYDDWSRHRTGRWLRDDKRWRYLLEYAKSKAVFKRDALEGYLLYETQDHPPGERRIRLLECVSATDAARRGLAGFLAEQPNVTEIEYTASLDDMERSGLLEHAETSASDALPRIDVLPGLMFRVVDLHRALESLRPNWTAFEGEVTLALEDENAPKDAPRAVTIVGKGACIEVRPVAQEKGRSRIEGDVRAWSAVLAGHLSLEDALSMNRLRARSESAAQLAGPLFPRRQPFIPTPDLF